MPNRFSFEVLPDVKQTLSKWGSLLSNFAGSIDSHLNEGVFNFKTYTPKISLPSAGATLTELGGNDGLYWHRGQICLFLATVRFSVAGAASTIGVSTPVPGDTTMATTFTAAWASCNDAGSSIPGAANFVYPDVVQVKPGNAGALWTVGTGKICQLGGIFKTRDIGRG